MNEQLSVFHNTVLVGHLTSGSFTYSESWVTSGFPIGAALPLTTEPYSKAAQDWFSNLLPEGGTRERLARRLRLSPDDDFGLLRSLGRECAGALTILAEGEQPIRSATEYRALTDEEVESLTRGASTLPLIQEEGRLSLAGAQDKLPVFRDKDPRLRIPLGGAPSSHILKLPNRDFGNLVANEFFCLKLAQAVGLPSVHAEIVRLNEVPALLVQRYDRKWLTGRTLERLHQEDFNQALGRSRHHKYEQERGATLADCANLIRETGTRPALEIRDLLRWLAFNFLIGNRDNHAKNISRLLTEPGGATWHLAPFYDLLNTTGYKLLTRKLAFSIGGTFEAAQVRAPEWASLAQDLGLSLRFVNDEVREMLARIKEQIEPTREAATEELGREAGLSGPYRAIKKAVRLGAEAVE